VSAWLKRFGLHLAAAVGATGIFVVAAAVGANQTRQQVASVAPTEVVSVTATARPPRPTVVASPATRPNQVRRTQTPATEPVAPERSLAGTVKDVLPDGLDVVGVGGREWHVVPAPGALIRLNGKAARLDALHVGDTVVILGQAQAREGPLFRFLSHAITARRK
jgi:hypothetical protein